MLARKGPGKEAKLSYHGHLMTENRNGLVVNTQVTTAYGSAECHAGLLMAEQLPGCGRVTLGADKGYDQREFIEELRHMGVTPHVAQNQGRRRSRLDQRTIRHPGYEISQRKRKRIEEVFGWMKTVGLLRQLRHRGLERVGWVFTLAAATYNLVRMRTLMPKCA
jgi:IS5 family transposase